MPTPTVPTFTRVPGTAMPRASRSSTPRAAVITTSAVSRPAARRATAPAVPKVNVTRWPLSARKRSAMAVSGACTPRGHSTVISSAPAPTATSVRASAAAPARPRTRSVPARAVDDLQQGTAAEEPRESVAPELGHQGIAVRMQAADVGEHHDPRRGPERVLGGERLDGKDVEDGARDATLAHRAHQVGIHDEIAAAEIQEECAR